MSTPGTPLETFEYVNSYGWYSGATLIATQHLCEILEIPHFGTFIKSSYNIRLTYNRQDNSVHLVCYAGTGSANIPAIYHNIHIHKSELKSMWNNFGKLVFTPLVPSDPKQKTI